MNAPVLPQFDQVEEQSLPLLDAPAEVLAPRVNLLPPEIAEQRAVRKLAIALAGAVVLCVAAVGGGWVYAGQGESQARADLASAQSTQTALQRKQQALLPAQTAQNQVQAAQRALAAAMGNEVLWSRYLDQLRLKRPEGVRFSSVALTPADSGSSGSSSGSSSSGSSGSSSALPSGSIASLTLSGMARSQPDVAALLDQLSSIPGFTGVYLTSTSKEGSSGVINYTVTAGVTAEALSHRYTAEGN